MVTMTFQRKGESTLITLVHSGLPEGDMAKAHEAGWNSILDKFRQCFSQWIGPDGAWLALSQMIR